MLSPLTQFVQQIQTGALDPQEVVDSCLARIRERDPQIAAWVLVDEEGARSEAARLAELARQGRLLGPLHGVPIGVKDIFDVVGMPTRAGISLREHHVATNDAPFVARLRAAGAIVLGKTVTTQMACFDPAATRNPLAAEHTPGGSSSGSAAAVAAGMCSAALGSQTGGSIIRPAAYCGIAGLKPTFGSVELEGAVLVSPHLDHIGPMASCVADLRAMWSVLQRPSWSIGTDGTEREGEGAVRKLRLGTIQDYFVQRTEACVRKITERALARFEQHGAELVPLTLPVGWEQVHPMHRRIMAYDAAQLYGNLLAEAPEAFLPNLKSLLHEGAALSETEYREALAHQEEFRATAHEWIRAVDAVVLPATPTVAPRSRTTTGDPSFNSPWSYCGLPVVTFRAGWTSERLPSGLQLVGAARDEMRLLAVAEWCEGVLED